MSIKYRITLLVTAAGFIASVLFSIVIFYELIEQPFYILDMELEEEANRAVKIIELNQSKADLALLNLPVFENFPSWVKIYEKGSERLIYQSELSKKINLPQVKSGSAANVKAMVPDDKINPGQNNSKKVPFRIRTFDAMTEGINLKVQVALPMNKLEEEIQELVLGLIAGLLFSSLALIVISYFVAGRILKPIGEMKDLTQIISDKNLDKRIPVDAGRDEFTELARTINRMLDRLQSSFERQRDLLFDTSHELKTPLTTIRLAIDDICSSEELLNIQPSLNENIFRVTEQVIRMERLIKDLLNLSALEVLTGIDSKPINLIKVLTSLIEDYHPLAAARDINIEISTPGELVIQGDEEKIKRAFSNILDNAIKYNIEEGRIEISAGFSEAEIEIVVSNTGTGVSETEISRIFDQFYRVEKSRSTYHGGSGLGLAIVKRIIELHGGRVDFKSSQGDLTHVTVTFPQYTEKLS